MKTKQTGTEGDFLEIEISPNRFVYCRKIKSPSIAIYDKLFIGQCTDINAIYSLDILIKLSVFEYTIVKKRWKIIGNIPLEDSLQGEPEYWKKEYRPISDECFQNEINPGFDYFITDGENLLRCITKEERRGFAKDAVYTPEFIEECLRKHYGIDEFGNNKAVIHLYDSLLISE